MGRAVRLMMDTGMHTRDQAIQLFKDNLGKAGPDIPVVVDR